MSASLERAIRLMAAHLSGARDPAILQTLELLADDSNTLEDALAFFGVATRDRDMEELARCARSPEAGA